MAIAENSRIKASDVFTKNVSLTPSQKNRSGNVTDIFWTRFDPSIINDSVEWTDATAYVVDTYVREEQTTNNWDLYRCIEDHTSDTTLDTSKFVYIGNFDHDFGSGDFYNLAISFFAGFFCDDYTRFTWTIYEITWSGGSPVETLVTSGSRDVSTVSSDPETFALPPGCYKLVLTASSQGPGCGTGHQVYKRKYCNTMELGDKVAIWDNTTSEAYEVTVAGELLTAADANSGRFTHVGYAGGDKEGPYPT